MKIPVLQDEDIAGARAVREPCVTRCSRAGSRYLPETRWSSSSGGLRLFASAGIGEFVQRHNGYRTRIVPCIVAACPGNVHRNVYSPDVVGATK